MFGGCRYLQPPLTIQKVPCAASPLALVGGPDVERLPTASTCYNLLKVRWCDSDGTPPGVFPWAGEACCGFWPGGAPTILCTQNCWGRAAAPTPAADKPACSCSCPIIGVPPPSNRSFCKRYTLVLASS